MFTVWKKKPKFILTREGNKASRWRLDCYRKIIKPDHPIRFHQRREMESLRKARRMCLWLASRVFKNLDIDWSWTLNSQRWGIPGGERTLQGENNVGSISRVQKSLSPCSPAWHSRWGAWMWRGRGRLGERRWCLRTCGKQRDIQRAPTRLLGALDGSMLSLFRVGRPSWQCQGRAFGLAAFEWGMGVDVSTGDLNQLNRWGWGALWEDLHVFRSACVQFCFLSGQLMAVYLEDVDIPVPFLGRIKCNFFKQYCFQD